MLGPFLGRSHLSQRTESTAYSSTYHLDCALLNERDFSTKRVSLFPVKKPGTNWLVLLRDRSATIELKQKRLNMSMSNTEKTVKGIRRKFASEEKIHIVLDGLRGK